MEDDDIEYDITFPSPSTGIDDGDEILDDYVIEGESIEPVIILIGWAGCKPKHLAKYCKIYEKRYRLDFYRRSLRSSAFGLLFTFDCYSF